MQLYFEENVDGKHFFPMVIEITDTAIVTSYANFPRHKKDWIVTKEDIIVRLALEINRVWGGNTWLNEDIGYIYFSDLSSLNYDIYMALNEEMFENDDFSMVPPSIDIVYDAVQLIRNNR